MIKLTYFGEEQIVYYEKLDNGLEVFIAPNKMVNSYRVDLVAKLGASVTEFIPVKEKEYIKMPLGTAHFLEHKLFDTKDGDATFLFDDAGVVTNASTNYYYTNYFIEGKKQFKKNLNLFLDVFYTPYFEKDRIENEKGIIGEEIDMYIDDPDWVLYRIEKESVFNKALKDEVAGTRETISEINADILEKVYNTFYQPSNTFLVISGKVNPKEALDIIKSNESIKKRMSNYPVIFKKIHEDLPVNREYGEGTGLVVIPKLSYYFKYDVNEFKFLSPEKFKAYLNILFYILFGDGSDFSEKIHEEKIANYFYIDTMYYENIYIIGICGESEYADIFKDEIDKTLENLQINKDDFEREIKVRNSIIIRELDNISDVSYSIIRSIINRGKYIDDKEILDSLKYEEFLAVIKKLSFDNKAFNLLLPKEKKS